MSIKRVLVILPGTIRADEYGDKHEAVMEWFDKNRQVPGRKTVAPSDMNSYREWAEGRMPNGDILYSSMNTEWHKNLVIHGVVQRFEAGQNFIANRTPDGVRQIEFDGWVNNPDGIFDDYYDVDIPGPLVVGSTAEEDKDFVGDREHAFVNRARFTRWSSTWANLENNRFDYYIDARDEDADNWKAHSLEDFDGTLNEWKAFLGSLFDGNLANVLVATIVE